MEEGGPGLLGQVHEAGGGVGIGAAGGVGGGRVGRGRGVECGCRTGVRRTIGGAVVRWCGDGDGEFGGRVHGENVEGDVTRATVWRDEMFPDGELVLLEDPDFDDMQPPANVSRHVDVEELECRFPDLFEDDGELLVFERICHGGLITPRFVGPTCDQPVALRGVCVGKVEG